MATENYALFSANFYVAKYRFNLASWSQEENINGIIQFSYLQVYCISTFVV